MKKIAILCFAVGIMASCAGCQAIKKVFVKPPPEGVVERSYAIPVYAYQSSVVVKATPQELMAHFLKDLSWLEKALGSIQLELSDLKPGIDMTEVGQSFNFTIKILGLNFPCRMINFKYKPDRELWVMILTGGTWLLGRIEAKPVPGGSMLNFNTLGKPSKTLAAVLDTFQLNEAVAGQIDLLMAFVQSEFDPELDVKEVTEKGLRGESYKELLQAYEASVWIDASPDKTDQWILSHYESYMPEMKLRGDCISFTGFLELAPGEVKYCQGTLEILKQEVNVGTLFTWRKKGREHTYQIYLQTLDQIGLTQMGVIPEAGGTRVQGMVVMEIPGMASPQIMDMIMALTAVPKRMRKMLSDIKQGVEGVG